MQPLQLPGGVEAIVWLRGEDTGGALTMLTDSAPPGWRLPPHRHRRESETIHVAAGRLWMTVDGERRELGPGDTIHIEPGTLHEGGTAGTDPVERIVVFAPAGMETFFDEIAETGDPSAQLEAALRHGWDFA